MKNLPRTLLLAAGTALSLVALASSNARIALQENGSTAGITAGTTADRQLNPLLSNIRFIGASITAGYGNASELKLGINAPLAQIMRAALADHSQGATLEGSGSNFFFHSPQTTGSGQVAKAVAASPTLVVALDFLFWYGFGHERYDKPRRAEGLEQGLDELVKFECPLIIGTFPSIDHALQGVGPLGGPVISEYQLPSEAERIEMNRRILSWAAERDHVQVVDVDGMFRSIVAGETFQVHGEEVRMKGLRDAFQEDLLHLSLDAYTWTAIAVCDAAAKLEAATEHDFVFDSAKIRMRFLASVAEAQAKQSVRMAKRLAREAAREARKKKAAIR